MDQKVGKKKKETSLGPLKSHYYFGEKKNLAICNEALYHNKKGIHNILHYYFLRDSCCKRKGVPVCFRRVVTCLYLVTLLMHCSGG